MTNANAPFIIFPGFIALMVIAYIVSTYNNFIKYRNRIEESWSSIDIALKRRVNLIPNLVEIVRGYEEHESELLQKVSRRFSESRDEPLRMEEESRLSRSLHGLLAVAEGYPDLKASGNFLSLQHNLNEIEKEIQQTRNRHNIEVRKYNTLVESFPSFFLARKFGFTKKDYFTLELATQGDMLRVDFSAKDSALSS